MSNDGYGASLNYIFVQDQRWRWIFNLLYQNAEYDAVNPVYGVQDEYDRFGASATVFYSAPFGWKGWAFNATAAFFEEDHDIDFFDTTVGALTFGLFRAF